MAKLNPNLASLMTSDLTQLHEIGQEMLKYVKTCDVHSWRYPEKKITEIDIQINNLVLHTSEKYVLLLELIIDRLYLVLNVLLDIMNTMPELSKRTIFTLPKNVYRPTSLSFGVLVTFLWRRIKFLLETSQINKNPAITIDTTTSTTDLINSCKICSSVMPNLKHLVNSFKNCLEELRISSLTNTERLNITADLVNLSQSEVFERLINAIVYDANALSNFAKEKLNTINELNDKLIKLNLENQENLKNFQNAQDYCYCLEKNNRDKEALIRFLHETKDYTFVKFNKLSLSFKESQHLCKIQQLKIQQLDKTLQEVLESAEEEKMKEKNAHNEQISELKFINEQLKKIADNSNEETKQLQHKNHELQALLQIKNDERDKKHLDEVTNLKLENMNMSQQIQKLKLKLETQQKEYNAKVKKLEETNSKYEEKVKKYKDKELLLIKCPDLNGTIVYKHENFDPLTDMQEQIKANQVRIKLLTKQNETLKRTIGKMKQLKAEPANK